MILIEEIEVPKPNQIIIMLQTISSLLLSRKQDNVLTMNFESYI